MRFGYTQFVDQSGSRSSWRPILQVRVHGPVRAVVLDMLVDTGSDYTMIPMSTAKALGLDITAEKYDLRGVGGTIQEGQIASASFSFKGYSWTGEVVVADSFDTSLCLLGQRTFFQNFWVAFDGATRAFWVSHTRRRRDAGG